MVVLGPDAMGRVMQALAGLMLIRALVPADFASLTITLSAVAACTTPLTAAANRLLLVTRGRGIPVSIIGNLRPLSVLAVPATLAYSYRGLGADPLLLFSTVLLSVALMTGEIARTRLQASGHLAAYGLAELLRSATLLAGVTIVMRISVAPHTALELVLGVIVLSYAAPLAAAYRSSPLQSSDPVIISHLTVRELLSAATLYAVLVGLASQVVLLQVARLLAVDDLAAFSAAFRLYALSFVVVNSLHSVILATVGTSDEADVAARLLSQRGVRFALAFAFVLLSFTASIWMPIATNHRYLDALPALRILLLTGVSASTLGAMVVIPMRQGQWRSLCLIALAGLLLQVALTHVLVPQRGIEGAAIAVFVSFTLLNCAVAGLALQRRRPIPNARSISLA